jgi:hypothetical protein
VPTGELARDLPMKFTPLTREDSSRPAGRLAVPRSSDVPEVRPSRPRALSALVSRAGVFRMRQMPVRVDCRANAGVGERSVPDGGPTRHRAADAPAPRSCAVLAHPHRDARARSTAMWHMGHRSEATYQGALKAEEYHVQGPPRKKGLGVPTSQCRSLAYRQFCSTAARLACESSTAARLARE